MVCNFLDEMTELVAELWSDTAIVEYFKKYFEDYYNICLAICVIHSKIFIHAYYPDATFGSFDSDLDKVCGKHHIHLYELLDNLTKTTVVGKSMAYEVPTSCQSRLHIYHKHEVTNLYYESYMLVKTLD